MPLSHVVFLVEDRSTEAFLAAWFGARPLGTWTFEIHPFGGKQAMLKRLPDRLRAYAAWPMQSRRIVVILDRDSQDCEILTAKLNSDAKAAGLRTRTIGSSSGWDCAICIAIEELEAWYFGDWDAVRKAYPNASVDVPRRAKFKNKSDALSRTAETFEGLMKKAGYFPGGLQKITAATSIGVQIEPDRNTSPSFQHLIRVLNDVTR